MSNFNEQFSQFMGGSQPSGSFNSQFSGFMSGTTYAKPTPQPVVQPQSTQLKEIEADLNQPGIFQNIFSTLGKVKDKASNLIDDVFKKSYVSPIPEEDIVKPVKKTIPIKIEEKKKEIVSTVNKKLGEILFKFGPIPLEYQEPGTIAYKVKEDFKPTAGKWVGGMIDDALMTFLGAGGVSFGAKQVKKVPIALRALKGVKTAAVFAGFRGLIGAMKEEDVPLTELLVAGGLGYAIGFFSPQVMVGFPKRSISTAKNVLKRYGFEASEFKNPEILKSKLLKVVNTEFVDIQMGKFTTQKNKEYRIFIEAYNKVTSAGIDSKWKLPDVTAWINKLWNKQGKTDEELYQLANSTFKTFIEKIVGKGSKSMELTPKAITDIVVNSNLENTSLGKVMLKLSIQANKQGKNLIISQLDSSLKGDNIAKSPDGANMGVRIVEPTEKADKPPVIEEVKPSPLPKKTVGDRGEVAKELKPLAKEAKKIGISPESRVYLVGARASGEVKAGSDWDIVVEGITDAQKNKLFKKFDFYSETNIHIASSKLEKGKPFKDLGKFSDFYAKTLGDKGGVGKVGKLKDKIKQIELSNTQDITPKLGESKLRQIDKLQKQLNRLETGTEIVVGKDGKEYLIDSKQPPTPQPLKEGSLYDEARKYKSAEEFVKAQKTIYHGTAEAFEKFDIKKSADGTIWFTDNMLKIEKGEVSATGKGKIMERIIDESNLKLGGWEETDKFSTGELINQGYDGLKLVEKDEITYQIFYPEKLLTKQQLTDIYNQAKQPPTPQPLKAKEKPEVKKKEYKLTYPKEKELPVNVLAELEELQGGFRQDFRERVEKGKRLSKGDLDRIGLRIKPLDIKTLLRNSPEFKAKPILTYKETKAGFRLVFEGKKQKFSIVPEAMGITFGQLLPGDIINLEGFEAKGKIPVLKKGVPSGYGDPGGYADVKSTEKRLSDIKAVEMPELVRIARSIMGETPSLKRFRSAIGMFYARGSGIIKLSPDVFKNPELAAKVMAHEIGHMADYFPDKTMARGNLLGRIASLNRYLKTSLGEFPDSIQNLITPKDRIRIKKEAQKMGKKNYELVTKDVEISKEPTNTKEILSIWNDTTSRIKSPELLAYVQGLTDIQKSDLVKNAMRGTIPKWVDFKKSITKTITEKVLRNSPADIRKLYEKLLNEEILKRRLFDLKTIKTELQMLSQKWKPYNPNQVPESYVKYRSSSRELYADAISVLFNDPVLLKKEAPSFYKGFFNYLEQKPTLSENLNKTWELLNQGEEAVFKARDEELGKSFKKGEDTFVAKELEKQKRQTSLMYQLNTLFNDKNTPIIAKVRQAQKAGKPIAPEDNPEFALHGFNYTDGKLKNYVNDNFQPILQKAQEVSDGWNSLGKVLFYERVINERGELANPQGYDPKTAGSQLEKMENEFSKEEWGKIQEAKGMFRKAVQESVDFAEKNKFYSPDMITQMKMNPAYASYQVIDYLDTYISARVYQSVGTLKDIANPATSTVMKLISVRKAIERNNVKKLNIKFLQKEFSEEIEPAKTKWNGKFMEVRDPSDPDTGLVITIEDGKPQGFYLSKDIADTLNHTDNKTIRAMANVSKMVSKSGFYRPLFTSFNLGFQTFNFVRDFMRYWKNVPDQNIGAAITSFPRAIARYAQAAPHSAKRALSLKDDLIKEMENAQTIGLTYNDMFKSRDIDEHRPQIDRVMGRAGIIQNKKRNILLTPFHWVMDSIETTGNFIETLPKVAGYIELKGKMPEAEMAEFIRTSVGSPDFRIGGTATPVSNNIFLFSNAIKEGIKSDAKIAFTKNKSRAGFWWKTVVSSFLPKVIMAAVAGGYFGEKLKEQMDKASEYDKTNYNVLPLGEDENGKAVYLRIPQDETGRFYGGMFWKMLNLNKKDKSIQDVFDIFSFGAGQFPNLSPAFTGVGALVTYLAGKNPYDSFRGRNVIPDKEFSAGPEYSFPILMTWLAKNQGLGIFYPTNYNYYNEKQTALQNTLNKPFISNILGRWIKVSDYGITEKYRKTTKVVEKEQAIRLLDEREKLDKAIKEYQAGKQGLSVIEKMEKQLVKDIVGEPPYKGTTKAKATNTKKKFRIAILRGESDERINAVISANTNDEKLTILGEIKKDMGGEEYITLLRRLHEYKVISEEVGLKAKKL